VEPNTHLGIDRALCGAPRELAPGRARVELTTTRAMACDERGLVHGGFVFGLADHAAMLAVNDPHVVLGAAETRFLAPVTVGETLVAEASLGEVTGRKHRVDVVVRRGDREVFVGALTCFVLPQHVLDA